MTKLGFMHSIFGRQKIEKIARIRKNSMLDKTACHRMLDNVKNHAIFTAFAFQIRHIGVIKRGALHNIDSLTSKST